MHRDQRYDTIGDWWKEGGCNQIRVSSMGNPDYEFLVAIHEMVEQHLCKAMGISEQTVDAFDLANEDVDEPGEMETCPYREAHMRAEAIERVLAIDLGVDWEHYSKTVRATVKETPLPKDPTAHGQTNLGVRSYEHEHVRTRANRPPKKRTPKQIARSVLRDR